MPRSGLPDPALFPRGAWLRHYRDALRDLADSRLLYPPPRGEPELRAALTAYLGRVRGVRAAMDQVVICDGVSQGVLLLCRALSRRGVTRIAVEDPCFVYHRLLIRAAGLEPVPVPVDEDGIQASHLAGLEVGAVLLSPAHSYPGGAVLSAAAGRAAGLGAHGGRGRDRGRLRRRAALRPAAGRRAAGARSRACRLLRQREQGPEPHTAARLDRGAAAAGQHRHRREVLRGLRHRGTRPAHPRPLHRQRRLRPPSAARPSRLPCTPRPPARRPQRAPPRDTARRQGGRPPPPPATAPGLDPCAVADAAFRHGIQLEETAQHWADPAAAPPAVLIGYGTLRESTLARGIEALAADLRGRPGA